MRNLRLYKGPTYNFKEADNKATIFLQNLNKAPILYVFDLIVELKKVTSSVFPFHFFR